MDTSRPFRRQLAPVRVDRSSQSSHRSRMALLRVLSLYFDLPEKCAHSYDCEACTGGRPIAGASLAPATLMEVPLDVDRPDCPYDKLPSIEMDALQLQ